MSNQGKSLAAFLAQKERMEALLAELQEACANHFDADPEAVLWGEESELRHANSKLQDIADSFARRGEYAA